MKDYLNEAYADLLVEMDAPLLWVTLNRPQCSNAFSDEMITELCRLFREADWDDDVRVIILTGAGKTFCAGGDVKAMEEKTGMFAGDQENYSPGAHSGNQQPSRSVGRLSGHHPANRRPFRRSASTERKTSTALHRALDPGVGLIT